MYPLLLTISKIFSWDGFLPYAWMTGSFYSLKLFMGNDEEIILAHRLSLGASCPALFTCWFAPSSKILLAKALVLSSWKLSQGLQKEIGSSTILADSGSVEGLWSLGGFFLGQGLLLPLLLLLFLGGIFCIQRLSIWTNWFCISFIFLACSIFISLITRVNSLTDSGSSSLISFPLDLARPLSKPGTSNIPEAFLSFSNSSVVF